MCVPTMLQYARRVTDPWRAEGVWLRCALHAHTTDSDGELSPHHLARHYARADYDVLAITDHWTVTDAAAVDRLVVIPSVELNCVLPGELDGHVLGFGVRADEEDLSTLRAAYADLERTAGWIAAHEGVAYLAHPYWSGVTPGSVELPENVAGIEVFNAGCELEVGRGLSSVHWDELLETGRLCAGIATDDSHHPGFDSNCAWTWVRAAERSADAVLAALATGSLYGSEGPMLHDLRRNGDAVDVHCSPSRSVTLVSGKRIGSAVHAGRLGYAHGGQIVERDERGLLVRAQLTVPPAARHARVEVADEAGRKAWSGPFSV
jgi:hypothetical protein